MRVYDEKRKLKKIICNSCGCEAEASNEIVKKDFLSVRKDWGYFSERDGETDRWDLCETCYQRIVSEFKIKVQVSDTTELMNV